MVERNEKSSSNSSEKIDSIDNNSKFLYGVIFPFIVSVIGATLSFLALGYGKDQANAAIASQTPYIVLMTEYDTFKNRRGIFLSNQGKGIAIVESIKINGEDKTSITQYDWTKLLNDKHLQPGCFDLAIPIHKGMAINEGSSVPIIATTINYDKMLEQMENINKQMGDHINNIGRLDFFRENFSLLKDEKLHNDNIEDKLNNLIDNEKNRMHQLIDAFEENKNELMLCSNDMLIQELEKNIKIEITYTSLLEQVKPKLARRFTLFENN